MVKINNIVMNQGDLLLLNKENLQPLVNQRRAPGSSKRVFGKELQNLRHGEQTPKTKASRVASEDSGARPERRISVVESLASMPQLVSDHLPQIASFLRSQEAGYKVARDYMSSQKDINAKMRSILVDWLVDVSLKFKLLPQTLFMAVNVLDRYLSKAVISRQQLQLIGVTSLMIVAKFEEIYPPALKDYVAVCDNAYTKKDLVEMEANVLKTLDYDLVQTCSFAFLRQSNGQLQLDDKLFVFARYLLETALLDLSSLKHSNSALAAGAIFLVNKIFKLEGWPASHAEASGFSEADVKLPAKDLFMIMQKAEAGELAAVRRKFADPAFFEVSQYKIEKAGNKN